MSLVNTVPRPHPARRSTAVYDNATRQYRLVAANHVVHFLRESHWPATIQTAGGVGRIGRTSYAVATALFLDGEW